MLDLLGIDYGSKRIGLALGSLQEGLAFPFDFIENKGKDFVFKELKELCEKEKISKIIIGMPVNLKNQKSQKTEEVIKFVEDLKKVCTQGKEIITEDERFTTKMVESMQKEMDGAKVASIDAVSAMLILQGYIDRLKNS